MPPGPSSSSHPPDSSSVFTFSNNNQNRHQRELELEPQSQPQPPLSPLLPSFNSTNATDTRNTGQIEPDSSPPTPKLCSRCGQAIESDSLNPIHNLSAFSSPIPQRVNHDQDLSILCNGCLSSIASITTLSRWDTHRQVTATATATAVMDLDHNNQSQRTRDGNGHLVRAHLQSGSGDDQNGNGNGNRNRVEESNAGLLRILRDDSNAVRNLEEGDQDSNRPSPLSAQIHLPRSESDQHRLHARAAGVLNDEDEVMQDSTRQGSSVTTSRPINDYQGLLHRHGFSSENPDDPSSSSIDLDFNHDSSLNSNTTLRNQDAQASTSSLSSSPVRNRRESFSRSQTSPNSSFGAQGLSSGRIGVGIPASNGAGGAREAIGIDTDEIIEAESTGMQRGLSDSGTITGRRSLSNDRNLPRVSFPNSSSSSSSSSSNLTSRRMEESSKRRHDEGSKDHEMDLDSHKEIGMASSSKSVQSQVNPGPKPLCSSSPFGPQNMTRSRISQRSNFASTASPNLSSRIPGVYQRKYSSFISRDSSNSKFPTSYYFNPYLPDPLQDSPFLSKRRLLPSSLSCLFPGSVFKGTQKSGRSSYEVQVSILNLDLGNSTLCGYLNIRGLTKDWPELTTFFEAEIIGDRFGFLTKKDWGATEKGDLKHWSRFPPFKALKPHLTKPELKFNHLNKSFIFMRWKERFLVPDHRVRDINGASFAGFYYVCVELGEENATDPVPLKDTNLKKSSLLDGDENHLDLKNDGVDPMNLDNDQVTRNRQTGLNTDIRNAAAAQSSSRNQNQNQNQEAEDLDKEFIPFDNARDRKDSIPNYLGTKGRMTGFYFHENSEPYQQLTLEHQPESCSSNFEFR